MNTISIYVTKVVMNALKTSLLSITDITTNYKLASYSGYIIH